MKLYLLVLASLLVLQATVDCQSCDGNLIDALQNCATSIQNDDSLAVQQEKCAPTGCNYDCPSANAIDDLSQQLDDVSSTLQQLMTKVDDQGTSIDQLTVKVNNNADGIASQTTTIQQLTTKVDTNTNNIGSLETTVTGNVGDISTLKGQQSDTDSVVEDVSSDLQQAQSDITTNMGDITTLQGKQSNTSSTVQNLQAVQDTLLKSVANNSAAIDLLIEHVEHPCGSAGWTRIAYLDMNDPEQECPEEFMEYSSGDSRACGRKTSNSASCNSITFATNTSYTEVCGKVLGYQKGTPQAINTGTGHYNLNSFYVDGISITYGVPPSRQHIWTFMGSNKDHGNGVWTCPCNIGAVISVQSFIGDDFFCESGYIGNEPNANTLYVGDPLWDGETCRNKESPCCQIPGLPWFTKTLSSNVTEDIELRVCGDESTANEDTPVFYYELYVK